MPNLLIIKIEKKYFFGLNIYQDYKQLKIININIKYIHWIFFSRDIEST